MTPEKKVKTKVVAILKELGAYYFYPITGGYGASGVPDIVGCYKGRFFAIECKANGNTPTVLQQREMYKITEAGGITVVIDETNLDLVRGLIKSLRGDDA